LIPVRTLRLILAYDGTAFAGWQSQRGQRTVQGVLHAAVAQVAGHEPKTLASSRTDAGVHALGQVVGVRVETRLAADVLQRALNANLPPDVCVREVCDVPATFHPLRDAVRKHYRYAIHDGPTADVFARHFCWRYACGRLDVAAMRRAAAALCGTHDFRSFATSGSPRKTGWRSSGAQEHGRWQMADRRWRMGVRAPKARLAATRSGASRDFRFQISDSRFQILTKPRPAVAPRANRNCRMPIRQPRCRIRGCGPPIYPRNRRTSPPSLRRRRAGQGRAG
jgi:tRNA pseudouridine(38-40) synthase